MKANGNSLVVPNVVEGQTWSADKVKAICKTTHLYIRAFEPIVGSEQLSESRSPEYHVPPPPSSVDFDSDLEDLLTNPSSQPGEFLCSLFVHIIIL